MKAKKQRRNVFYNAAAQAIKMRTTMLARTIAISLILCGVAVTAAGAATGNGYAIQPTDQLQVIVYGTSGVPSGQAQAPAAVAVIQPLSQTVTVLSDGTISYPLVGSVNVAGLSPEAAADHLAAALSAFVIHPKVSVIVVKGTQSTVKVLGAVDHGGQIELQRGDHLADAIAKAGVSPNSYADLNHITLNRFVDGVPHVYNLNLYNLLLNADYSANPLLEPGDIVYIPKAKQTNLANYAQIPFGLYYLYYLLTPGLNHTVGPP